MVLGAGKGDRMGELTEYCPKVLLPYKGKPILAYVLDNLPGLVSEAIIIVGYKAKAVCQFLTAYSDYFPITEVYQEQLTGDSTALLCAKHLLKDEDLFAVINGDVIIPKHDIETMLKIGLPLIAVSPYVIPLGVVTSVGNIVKTIREKPTINVNAGFFVLPSTIFPFLHSRDYISKALSYAVETKSIRVVKYQVSEWLHFSRQEDLENHS